MLLFRPTEDDGGGAAAVEDDERPDWPAAFTLCPLPVCVDVSSLLLEWTTLDGVLSPATGLELTGIGDGTDPW